MSHNRSIPHLHIRNASLDSKSTKIGRSERKKQPKQVQSCEKIASWYSPAANALRVANLNLASHQLLNNSVVGALSTNLNQSSGSLTDKLATKSSPRHEETDTQFTAEDIALSKSELATFDIRFGHVLKRLEQDFGSVGSKLGRELLYDGLRKTRKPTFSKDCQGTFTIRNRRNATSVRQPCVPGIVIERKKQLQHFLAVRYSRVLVQVRDVIGSTSIQDNVDFDIRNWIFASAEASKTCMGIKHPFWEPMELVCGTKTLLDLKSKIKEGVERVTKEANNVWIKGVIEVITQHDNLKTHIEILKVFQNDQVDFEEWFNTAIPLVVTFHTCDPSFAQRSKQRSKHMIDEDVLGTQFIPQTENYGRQTGKSTPNGSSTVGAKKIDSKTTESVKLDEKWNTGESIFVPIDSTTKFKVSSPLSISPSERRGRNARKLHPLKSHEELNHTVSSRNWNPLGSVGSSHAPMLPQQQQASGHGRESHNHGSIKSSRWRNCDTVKRGSSSSNSTPSGKVLESIRVLSQVVQQANIILSLQLRSMTEIAITQFDALLSHGMESQWSVPWIQTSIEYDETSKKFITVPHKSQVEECLVAIASLPMKQCAKDVVCLKRAILGHLFDNQQLQWEYWHQNSNSSSDQTSFPYKGALHEFTKVDGWMFVTGNEESLNSKLEVTLHKVLDADFTLLNLFCTLTLRPFLCLYNGSISKHLKGNLKKKSNRIKRERAVFKTRNLGMLARSIIPTMELATDSSYNLVSACFDDLRDDVITHCRDTIKETYSVILEKNRKRMNLRLEEYDNIARYLRKPIQTTDDLHRAIDFLHRMPKTKTRRKQVRHNSSTNEHLQESDTNNMLSDTVNNTNEEQSVQTLFEIKMRNNYQEVTTSILYNMIFFSLRQIVEPGDHERFTELRAWPERINKVVERVEMQCQYLASREVVVLLNNMAEFETRLARQYVATQLNERDISLVRNTIQMRYPESRMIVKEFEKISRICDDIAIRQDILGQYFNKTRNVEISKRLTNIFQTVRKRVGFAKVIRDFTSQQVKPLELAHSKKRETTPIEKTPGPATNERPAHYGEIFRCVQNLNPDVIEFNKFPLLGMIAEDAQTRVEEDAVVLKAETHFQHLLQSSKQSGRSLYAPHAQLLVNWFTNSKLVHELWKAMSEFLEWERKWKFEPLRSIQLDVVETETKEWQQRLRMLADRVESLPHGEHARNVCEMALRHAGEFERITLPVMELFCSPALKPRHLVEMEEESGLFILVNNKSNVEHMMFLTKPEVLPKVIRVCSSATQEYSVERTIRAVRQVISQTRFGVTNFDNTRRESTIPKNSEINTDTVPVTGMRLLTEFSHVSDTLNQQKATIQALLGNRFIGPYLNESHELLSQVNVFLEFTQTLKDTQQLVLDLYPTIHNEAMKAFFQVEVQNFELAQDMWRRIVKMASITGIVRGKQKEQSRKRESTDKESLLDDLEDNEILGREVFVPDIHHGSISHLSENKYVREMVRKTMFLLSRISRKLKDYLAHCRELFPRFFLISDKELLDFVRANGSDNIDNWETLFSSCRAEVLNKYFPKMFPGCCALLIPTTTNSNDTAEDNSNSSDQHLGASNSNDQRSGVSNSNDQRSGVSNSNDQRSGVSNSNDQRSGVSNSNDQRSGVSNSNDQRSGVSNSNDQRSGASNSNDQHLGDLNQVTQDFQVATKSTGLSGVSESYVEGDFSAEQSSNEDVLLERSYRIVCEKGDELKLLHPTCPSTFCELGIESLPSSPDVSVCSNDNIGKEAETDNCDESTIVENSDTTNSNAASTGDNDATSIAQDETTAALTQEETPSASTTPKLATNSQEETVDQDSEDVEPSTAIMHHSIRWLVALEVIMKSSLATHTANCMRDTNLSYDLIANHEVFHNYPTQSVQLCLELSFLKLFSQPLRSPQELRCNTASKTVVTAIERLTKLIQSNLKGNTSIHAQRICVALLHHRDVLDRLAVVEATQCGPTFRLHDSFEWKALLKYRVAENEVHQNDSEATILIDSMNKTFLYHGDYLGAGNLIVMTPLTERCFQSMVLFLSSGFGSALTGGQSSGKSETVLALSRAFGTACFTVHCASTTTRVALRNMLKVGSGTHSWICLDHFERLPLAVSSLLTTTLRTLHDTWNLMYDPVSTASSSTTAEHPHRDNVLRRKNSSSWKPHLPNSVFRPQSFVFVTMRGDHSVTEEGNATNVVSAESLLYLRPIAICQPDSRKIAHVLLQSHGFLSGQQWASKLHQLLQTNSEWLLSELSLPHGLRTYLAVVGYACKLFIAWFGSSSESQQDELIVILRAVEVIYIPTLDPLQTEIFRQSVKILFNVSSIFLDSYGLLVPSYARNDKQGMVSDKSFVMKSSTRAKVKTSTEITSSHKSAKWLRSRVSTICSRELGFAATADFVSKLVQFNDLLEATSKQVIVLGDPQTGKSSTITVLAKVYSTAHHPVRIETIYPKATTLQDLFGYTHSTGVYVSGQVAEAIAPGHNESEGKWIVFDGQLDPAWCDSLGTLVGDPEDSVVFGTGNKVKRCKDLAVVFETCNLQNVSPSFTSRSGILYLESNHIQPQTLFQNWLSSVSLVSPRRSFGLNSRMVQDWETKQVYSRGSNAPPFVLQSKHSNRINETMNWLFPPCLHFLLLLSKSQSGVSSLITMDHVEQTALHCVSSVIKVLESVLEEVLVNADGIAHKHIRKGIARETLTQVGTFALSEQKHVHNHAEKLIEQLEELPERFQTTQEQSNETVNFGALFKADAEDNFSGTASGVSCKNDALADVDTSSSSESSDSEVEVYATPTVYKQDSLSEPEEVGENPIHTLFQKQSDISNAILDSAVQFAVVWGLGSWLGEKGKEILSQFVLATLHHGNKGALSVIHELFPSMEQAWKCHSTRQNDKSTRKHSSWLDPSMMWCGTDASEDQEVRIQSSAMLPETSNVFSLFLSLVPSESGICVPKWQGWMENVEQPLESVIDHQNLRVVTEQTKRIDYFLELLTTHHYNSSLFGPPSAGKSHGVRQMLETLSTHSFQTSHVATLLNSLGTEIFNALKGRSLKRSSSNPTMEHAGKALVVFIDDLHMPVHLDRFGTQAPVEALRQVVNETDLNKGNAISTLFITCHSAQESDSVTSIARKRNPSKSSTRTLLRTFLMHIPRIGSKYLVQVFGTMLHSRFQSKLEFPSDTLSVVSEDVALAIVDVFQRIESEFPPTPAKPFYCFNLRDCARAVEGIIMGISSHIAELRHGKGQWIASQEQENTIKPNRVQNDMQVDNKTADIPQDPMHWLSSHAFKLPLLVAHELTRSLYDRLTTDDEKVRFIDILLELYEKHFADSPGYIDLHSMLTTSVTQEPEPGSNEKFFQQLSVSEFDRFLFSNLELLGDQRRDRSVALTAGQRNDYRFVEIGLMNQVRDGVQHAANKFSRTYSMNQGQNNWEVGGEASQRENNIDGGKDESIDTTKDQRNDNNTNGGESHENSDVVTNLSTTQNTDTATSSTSNIKGMQHQECDKSSTQECDELDQQCDAAASEPTLHGSKDERESTPVPHEPVTTQTNNPVKENSAIGESQQGTQKALETEATNTPGETNVLPGALIIFEFAFIHTLKILRVLSLPAHVGSLLLLGPAGCGRRSLVRLACFLLSIQVHKVADTSTSSVVNEVRVDTDSPNMEVTNTGSEQGEEGNEYASWDSKEIPEDFVNDEHAQEARRGGVKEWRARLSDALLTCGLKVSDEAVVLLIEEEEMKVGNDVPLSDLNILLNAGEHGSEQLFRILKSSGSGMNESGIVETIQLQCMSMFTQNATTNDNPSTAKEVNLSKVVKHLNATQTGNELTPEECMHEFQRRIFHNLHVVICMSPGSNQNFVRRLRDYSYVASCTTVVWMGHWVQPALEAVALRLSKCALSSIQHPDTVAKSCAAVYLSVFHIVHGNIEGLESIVNRDPRKSAAPAALNVTGTQKEIREEEKNKVKPIVDADVARALAVSLSSNTHPSIIAAITAPRTFMDFARNYTTILLDRRKMLETEVARLVQGSNQLSKISAGLAGLEEDLQQLLPQLERMTKSADELVETIEVQLANQVSDFHSQIKKGKKDVTECKRNFEETKALLDTAERKLTPILSEAQATLSLLNPAQLMSYQKSAIAPPDGMAIAMQAICLLLDTVKDSGPSKAMREMASKFPPVNRLEIEKMLSISKTKEGEDGVVDEEVTSEELERKVNKVHTAMLDARSWWPTSLYIMSRNDFISRLWEFDFVRPNDTVLEILEVQFVSTEVFRPTLIGKAGKMAHVLCQWVNTYIQYHVTDQQIQPLRKLHGLNVTALRQSERSLRNLKRELRTTEYAINDAQDSLTVAKGRAEEFESRVTKSRNRLLRARELVASLKFERQRWHRKVNELRVRIAHLERDCILGVASQAFLAPLRFDFRRYFMDVWWKLLEDHELFPSSMLDSTAIGAAAWSIQGKDGALPRGDTSSVFSNSLGKGTNSSQRQSISDAESTSDRFLVRSETRASIRLSQQVLLCDEEESDRYGAYTQDLVGRKVWVQAWRDDGCLGTDQVLLESAQFVSMTLELDLRMHGLSQAVTSFQDEVALKLLVGGGKWPLMIDPHGQGVAWVRKMNGRLNRESEIKRYQIQSDTQPKSGRNIGNKSHTLRTLDSEVHEPGTLFQTSLSDPELLQQVYSALSHGNTLLIEGFDMDAPWELSNLIKQQVVWRRSRSFVAFHIASGSVSNTVEVEWKLGFNCILATTLQSNDLTLSPEFALDVVVIDFSMTEACLEQRLMETMLENDEPLLVEERKRLTALQSEMDTTLVETENEVLSLLSRRAKKLGRLLDDESAVLTLRKCKSITDSVREDKNRAEHLNKILSFMEGQYHSVIHVLYLLYEYSQDLQRVNPVYQFSLSWFLGRVKKFTQLFRKEECSKSSITRKLWRRERAGGQKYQSAKSDSSASDSSSDSDEEEFESATTNTSSDSSASSTEEEYASGNVGEHRPVMICPKRIRRLTAASRKMSYSPSQVVGLRRFILERFHQEFTMTVLAKDHLTVSLMLAAVDAEEAGLVGPHFWITFCDITATKLGFLDPPSSTQTTKKTVSKQRRSLQRWAVSYEEWMAQVSFLCSRCPELKGLDSNLIKSRKSKASWMAWNAIKANTLASANALSRIDDGAWVDLHPLHLALLSQVVKSKSKCPENDLIWIREAISRTFPSCVETGSSQEQLLQYLTDEQLRSDSNDTLTPILCLVSDSEYWSSTLSLVNGLLERFKYFIPGLNNVSWQSSVGKSEASVSTKKRELRTSTTTGESRTSTTKSESRTSTTTGESRTSTTKSESRTSTTTGESRTSTTKSESRTSTTTGESRTSTTKSESRTSTTTGESRTSTTKSESRTSTTAGIIRKARNTIEIRSNKTRSSMSTTGTSSYPDFSDVKIRSICLGAVSPCEALDELIAIAAVGDWLILENCHLLEYEHWLQLSRQLESGFNVVTRREIDITKNELNSDHSESNKYTASHKLHKSTTGYPLSEKRNCISTFRLWLIWSSHAKPTVYIPQILSQQVIRVALELPQSMKSHYEESLSTVGRGLNTNHLSDKVAKFSGAYSKIVPSIVGSIALFHASLISRSCAGLGAWTMNSFKFQDSDLLLAFEILFGFFADNLERVFHFKHLEATLADHGDMSQDAKAEHEKAMDIEQRRVAALSNLKFNLERQLLEIVYGGRMQQESDKQVLQVTFERCIGDLVHLKFLEKQDFDSLASLGSQLAKQYSSGHERSYVNNWLGLAELTATNSAVRLSDYLYEHCCIMSKAAQGLRENVSQGMGTKAALNFARKECPVVSVMASSRALLDSSSNLNSISEVPLGFCEQTLRRINASWFTVVCGRYLNNQTHSDLFLCFVQEALKNVIALSIMAKKLELAVADGSKRESLCLKGDSTAADIANDILPEEWEAELQLPVRTTTDGVISHHRASLSGTISRLKEGLCYFTLSVLYQIAQPEPKGNSGDGSDLSSSGDGSDQFHTTLLKLQAEMEEVASQRSIQGAKLTPKVVWLGGCFHPVSALRSIAWSYARTCDGTKLQLDTVEAVFVPVPESSKTSDENIHMSEDIVRDCLRENIGGSAKSFTGWNQLRFRVLGFSGVTCTGFKLMGGSKLHSPRKKISHSSANRMHVVCIHRLDSTTTDTIPQLEGTRNGTNKPKLYSCQVYRSAPSTTNDDDVVVADEVVGRVFMEVANPSEWVLSTSRFVLDGGW